MMNKDKALEILSEPGQHGNDQLKRAMDYIQSMAFKIGTKNAINTSASTLDIGQLRVSSPPVETRPQFSCPVHNDSKASVAAQNRAAREAAHNSPDEVSGSEEN